MNEILTPATQSNTSEQQQQQQQQQQHEDDEDIRVDSDLSTSSEDLSEDDLLLDEYM